MRTYNVTIVLDNEEQEQQIDEITKKFQQNIGMGRTDRDIIEFALNSNPALYSLIFLALERGMEQFEKEKGSKI